MKTIFKKKIPEFSQTYTKRNIQFQMITKIIKPFHDTFLALYSVAAIQAGKNFFFFYIVKSVLTFLILIRCDYTLSGENKCNQRMLKRFWLMILLFDLSLHAELMNRNRRRLLDLFQFLWIKTISIEATKSLVKR